jgi:hypothetical protein
MKIQPGFVLDNLVRGEVRLALHCPDGRYNFCLFWNILLLDWCPMLVVDMSI